MLRRILLILIMVGVILTLGASFDQRWLARTPVFRIEVAQIVIPNGGTTEVTGAQNMNGIVRQIAVAINDNTGNATATVQIRDSDGAVLWSVAAIPENANTVYQYYTLSGTDLPLAILCTDTMTIGVTPSGDPGVSTMTADIVLWGI